MKVFKAIGKIVANTPRGIPSVSSRSTSFQPTKHIQPPSSLIPTSITRTLSPSKQTINKQIHTTGSLIMSSAFGPPSSPSTSAPSEMKEDYRQPLQVQSQVSIPVQSHSRAAPNETELVKERVMELKKTFKSGVTKPMEWRLSALRALRTVMVDNETELFAALEADLRKCAFDSWLTEYKNTLNEIDEAIHSLSSWMKPKRVNTNLFNLPGSSHIVSDPLGTVLVISPWNYPFYLAVAPLVGALAAGNSVMIKPSELAPNVSGWIAQTLGPAMSQYGVRVIEGGIPPTEALLKEQWDLIFYTGGGSVGRIILRAAAEHLTPVILELGGKSPAIVTRDANIDVAAKRIAWGKLLNTGQTCVGVDYILCDAAVHDELVNKIGIAIKNMYGANPKQSPDFGRIINTAHTKRLTALVDPLEDGLTVAVGDTKTISFDEKYIPPILLTGVQSHHRVMRDEIFGPILPIVKVDGAPTAVLREMIQFVNDRPKPLALYVFSGSSATIDSIIDNTSSGGVAVNDCVVHLTNPELPFGGVGPSGMGAYHGRKSFEIFSHSKSVLRRSDMSLLDAPQRYPPYSNSNLTFLKSIMWLQGLGLYKPWWYVLSTIVLLGVIAILVTKFAADLW